jgi:hypothetical protein
MCSALDNILKSRMCDPQVRFCERRRGASPFAYSTNATFAFLFLLFSVPLCLGGESSFEWLFKRYCTWRRP